MSIGRVKDPDGKQAKAGWGYIQRLEGCRYDPEKKTCVDVLWPGDQEAKVIPFPNPESKFSRGDLVWFDVDQAEVKGFKGIRLGIAINVKKLNKKQRKKCGFE